MTENAVQHAAVSAWFRAGGGEPWRVTVLKDRGHSNVYRLEGAGPDGTAVIAKHCSCASARIESFVYRDILPRLGVPALAFHGCVEDEDDRRGRLCWMFIEDAGDEGYLQHLDEHRALAGRWLGQLHAAAARLGPPAFLPERGPACYLAELRSVAKSIRGTFLNPALGESDRRTLTAILGQCDVLESRWPQIARLCEGIPPTLVHGDLAVKNTRVRTSGKEMALFALDWETAGWGTPAIDLAHNALRPDLAAWHSAMRHASVTAETVLRVAAAGRIFRVIESMSWETGNLAGGWPARAVRHMESYHAVLADCIQSARWEEAWRRA